MGNDAAYKIVESAIRDTGGDRDRHERRVAAMRSLGEAERRFDRFLKVAIWVPAVFLTAAFFLAIAVLAIVATYH